MARGQANTQENGVSTRRKDAQIIADQLLKQQNLPTSQEEEQLVEEEATEIDEGIPQDIFDFAHDLSERGEIVSYLINKDNKYLASVPHPFSWQEIQDQYGGGHFCVRARSERTKRFLKQQTQFVAPATKKPDEHHPAPQQAQAPAAPVIDPVDTFVRMAAILRPAESPQANADVQNLKNQLEQSSMMMKFMEMMTTQASKASETTAALLEKMQTSTNTLIEKIQNQNKEMIDKLEQRLTTMSTQKKEKDPMDFYTLMMQAEERGEKRRADMEKLVELKAKQLVGRDDDDKEPKSAIDKAVDTFAPLITRALANQATTPQPQQRPVAPAAPRNMAPRNIPNTPARPAQPPVGVKPQGTVGPAPSAQPKSPIPTTKLPDAKPEVREVKVEVLPKHSKEELMAFAVEGMGPKFIEATTKMPDVDAALANTRAAAEDTVALFKAKGINPLDLVKYVTREDMENEALKLGLPKEGLVWLNKYHADLLTITKPSKQ